MNPSAVSRTDRYDKSGGWDERRSHPDGHSYWRHGELHRADGYAVTRDSSNQVWLYGKPIETPEHRSDDPIFFSGQSKTGRMTWVDNDSAIRAMSVTGSTGIVETRWFDQSGAPEAHWSGGYHVSRLMLTGERRYYKQVSESDKPRLHRLDGPAIRHHDVDIKGVWCVDGARVQGPLELLLRHTVRAQQAADHGRDIVRLDLDAGEQSRLRAAVINNPDGELATDIAIAFPDEYHQAMVYLDSLDRL